MSTPSASIVCATNRFAEVHLSFVRAVFVLICSVAAQPAGAFQADTRTPYTPVRPIQVGQEVQGSFGESNASSEGGYFQDYVVHLKAKDRIKIDLESVEFDALLRVKARGRAEFELSDDDGGELSNASLTVTAPAEGDYIIRAESIDQMGSYNLKLSRVAVVNVQPRIFSGELSETSSITQVDGEYPAVGNPHKLYRFHGSAGERVVIEMLSADFDSELRLVRESAPTRLAPFRIVDDDSAGSNNARIAAVLPMDGDYSIFAVDGDAKPGSYTISVKRAPARPTTPPPVRLTAGTCTGTLDIKDANTAVIVRSSGQINSLYRMFTLPVEEGRKVTIDLTTPNNAAMDPVIEVGVPSPVGFAVAQSHDDISPTDKNARLVLTPTASGEVQIRARAYRAASGPFTLTVASGPEGVPAANSCPGP